MNFKTFAERGGFKLLAVARLSSGAYSVVCYLINTLTAGIEEVVTSPGELSIMLGVSERAVRNALEELRESHVVNITPGAGKTLALKFNLETSKWQNLRRDLDKPKGKRQRLGDAKNIHPLPTSQHPYMTEGLAPTPTMGLTSQDALLFPAKRSRGGVAQLTAFDGGRKDEKPKHENPIDVDTERVYSSFKTLHKGEHFDSEKEHNYARLLAETHPADQVITLIEHFKGEIPSLGMLAGAWLHYSEKYHAATHDPATANFQTYKRKFASAEKRLRSLAQSEMKRAQAHKRLLTPDEEVLLRLFLRHQHPRQQLYWALQARERYPHLQEFFDLTSDIAQPPGAQR